MTLADNVSRETKEQLEHYLFLLEKWNPRINLVAKSTMNEAWERHIGDSLQLFSLAPKAEHWVDLGSGGGFPGLVIAILRMQEGTPQHVTLVESDQRKSAFLRTVLRETGVEATVLAERIELCAPLSSDVLSARALANLPKLLEYYDRHAKSDSLALFPKGMSWREEVRAAEKIWRFSYDTVKSKTESGPVILKITGVSRV